MGKSRQWKIAGLRYHEIVAFEVTIIPEVSSEAQLFLCNHSKPRNRPTTLLYRQNVSYTVEKDEAVFYLFAKQFPNTKIRHTIRITFVHCSGQRYDATVFRDVSAAGHKYATGRKVKAREEALESNEIFWNPEEGFSLRRPRTPLP